MLSITSCGGKSNRFRLSGRMLNFNQGIFLIYSPDGGVDGIDTIKVEGGRFAYETTCDAPTTLVIVMPNFAELPIFAEPGEKVTIEGDASQLKKTEVKGTKDNKLMTAFRRQTTDTSPPETRRLAGEFVKAHPASAVAPYLIDYYFVRQSSPDYAVALSLMETVEAAQKNNNDVKAQKEKLTQYVKTISSDRLPSFTTTDINGNSVNSNDYNQGLTVVYTWATWNALSVYMQRDINEMAKESNQKMRALAICLDADKEECRSAAERENILSRQICDGQMFETKLLNYLGMSGPADNIIMKNGIIVERGIKQHNIKKKIRELL